MRQQEFFKDYYSVLGISRDATDKQIRSAYRKLSLKNHPDRGGDVDKFKEIQAAYEALGSGGLKSENRVRYDEGFDREIKVRSTREGFSRSTKESTSSARPESTSQQGYPVYVRYESRVKTIYEWKKQGGKHEDIYEIQLPKNDFAFMNALVKAYQADHQQTWQIKKSIYDKRDWVPEVLYRVYRDEKGQVGFGRIIDDWSRIYDPEMRSYRKTFFNRNPLKSGEFLDESKIFLLSEKSKEMLVPRNLADYYGSLRKLASHRANSGEPPGLFEEIKNLNSLVDNDHGYYLYKNRDPMVIDRGVPFMDKEPVTTLPYFQFWKQVEDAEGRVFKESQYSSSPENKG